MSETVGEKVLRDSLPNEEAKPNDTTSNKNIDKEEQIIENKSSSSSIWEIEEECYEDSNSIYEEKLLASIEEVASLDDHDDVVYVGVGNGNSSMDALVWTLTNIAINNSGTLVFLIHVFPETRSIPTPLGKMPISQVNPQHKETYLNQERSKRRDFLQKFLNLCSDSKVKVDTILIESDFGAKALLDLIPILNIRKLVLGTSKSGLRGTEGDTVKRADDLYSRNMKLRSRKGNGIADQVLQSAPEFCEIKVICEGELVDTEAESLSRSSSSSQREAVVEPSQTPDEVPITHSFACNCFKAKVIDR